MNQTIQNLLTEQLTSWETARNNYEALSTVKVKELNVNGVPYKVQFNPARIVSSGAKVDAKTIKERKCFLCPANLPAVQKGVPFKEHYNILVNPFPIFPRHLTVPEQAHVDQRIATRMEDMLDLAQALTTMLFSIMVRNVVHLLQTMHTSRPVIKASCLSKRIGVTRLPER